MTLTPDTIAICTINGKSDRVRLIAWDREAQCWLIESMTDASVRGLAEVGELECIGTEVIA